MNDTPEQNLDAALDASVGTGTVRYLKTLVTAMTITTILGLVVLVTVVVLQFSNQTASPVAAPALPDQITLPEGVTAEAVTFGKGWLLVVTDQDTVLVFDATSGNLVNTIALQPQ